MGAPYRVSLNEWLDFFGFSASPFSRWEAEEEARLYPERLSAQLVKPACFDRVLGQASEPKTVILFAPRGSGKTACRILVDYYCREGMGQGDRAETSGRVLSALHTHLDEAARQSRESEQSIDEYWHTREILRQSIQALIALLRTDSKLVEHVKTMLAARRLDLQWFFYAYPPQSAIDLEFVREQLEFQPFVLNGEGGLGFAPTASPQRKLAPELRVLLEDRYKTSPIDQLQLLVNLICASDPAQGLGFQAVYILVDGLDEFSYSADLTTDHGARLIIPLLTNLRLMNSTPRLAFKFFLPAEMASFIRQHPSIRHDRLGYETITWTDADMREILRRRLAMYGPVQEIDVLCAPELRGLEKTLIHAADGNPRRMMRLCSFTLNAHLDISLEQPPEEIGEAAYLLTRADWKKAQIRMAKELPQMASGEREGNREPVIVGGQEPVTLSYSPGLPEHLDNYPAPIALLYLDYLRRQEPFERLGRLLDLFEVTVTFVSIMLIAQLVALAGKATPNRLRAANLRFKRMSLGGWLTVWERLPGVCNSLGKSFYARRLQNIYAKEHNHLDALRVLRNQTRGHGATGSELAALETISRYAPEVKQVIASLHFLTDTRLIQVKDMQMQGGLFSHRARIYVGDNPNFPWERIELPKSLECDKMLLIRQADVLPLHPLIITARCPECQLEEIFTYQQIDGSEVQYLSYSSGHRLATAQYRQDIRNIIGV